VRRGKKVAGGFLATADGRQPSAVGPAVSAPTSNENGRGRIPSSCSHAISPPPGCAILSGSRCANFCSKPELSSPLHHRPCQSDGILLCAWWKNRIVRRWRGVRHLVP